MKFAIFGSMFGERSAEAEAQICRVCESLRRHGQEIYLPENFFLSLPGDVQQKVKSFATLFVELPNVDMAISVGGDGTFLRTSSIVGNSGIPVLGINTGRLGFLAAINFADVEDTFDEIVNGKYKIEERTLLKLTSDESSKPFGYHIYALNEVAILKQDTASMLLIHAYINNEYLTSYQADGLVIATPTGSTAYSLSAGGPVLTPTTPSIILSAIAPHNLTSRPLVVDDNSCVSLRVESRSHTFLVSIDGQSQVFNENVGLEIRKAAHRLKVVKRIGHTFYETLRDKLMWGADLRRK